MMNQFTKLLEKKMKDSHKNMQLVVGLNGLQLFNKYGTICSEFQSNSHQLMHSWEIEHLQCG